MKQPPIPQTHAIDAYVGPCLALIGWLFQLIVRIGAPRRSRRLKRAIEWAERAVQHLVFLWAVARMPPPPPRKRSCHYTALNTPPGFRRAPRRSRLFFRYARIALRRASFAQRIGHLIAVLTNPERYIERFLALLTHGLRPGALIAVAPPASAWRNAPARAVAFADSS